MRVDCRSTHLLEGSEAGGQVLVVPNSRRISLNFYSCQGAKQSRGAAELCCFGHLNGVYALRTAHTCDRAASAFQMGW